MIIDKILDFIFYFPMLLLEALPDLGVVIPGEVSNLINGTQTFLYNVAYVVPFPLLSPIFVISVSIKGFQIIWALVIRVKSFIPTMGD